MKVSSTNLHSQTGRARELTFWEKVHLPPRVTYQMSHVTCHMSRVTCHVSHVKGIFFYKVVKLVNGGSVINGPTLSSLNCKILVWHLNEKHFIFHNPKVFLIHPVPVSLWHTAANFIFCDISHRADGRSLVIGITKFDVSFFGGNMKVNHKMCLMFKTLRWKSRTCIIKKQEFHKCILAHKGT